MNGFSEKRHPKLICKILHNGIFTMGLLMSRTTGRANPPNQTPVNHLGADFGVGLIQGEA
jgi:hypothetical protein